jgi:hypothetical protein
MILERCQLLTTHNLAALVEALNLNQHDVEDEEPMVTQELERSSRSQSVPAADEKQAEDGKADEIQSDVVGEVGEVGEADDEGTIPEDSVTATAPLKWSSLVLRTWQHSVLDLMRKMQLATIEKDWHLKRVCRKDGAYAWRQLLFFASMLQQKIEQRARAAFGDQEPSVEQMVQAGAWTKSQLHARLIAPMRAALNKMCKPGMSHGHEFQQLIASDFLDPLAAVIDSLNIQQSLSAPSSSASASASSSVDVTFKPFLGWISSSS